MNINSQTKKALLLSLILCLVSCITSCKNNNKDDKFVKKDIEPVVIKTDEDILKVLSMVEYPTTERRVNYLESDFKEVLNDFSKKFTDIIFDNKNEFFSPISLYQACGMLYEGMSNADMINEFKSLMGYDASVVSNIMKNVYENNYYSNEQGRTHMANSIWIKNGLDVKNSYIDILKNQYYAVSYQVDFSNITVKQNIVDWINKNTEDLLKLDVNNYQVDDNLAVLLLNTIYFNNKWSTEFLSNNTKQLTFNLSKNKQIKTDFMNHTISSSYKKTDDYIVCCDYFYNANSITYIMPNNYDINTLKKYSYNDFYQDLDYYNINLFVPSFECFKEYNLKDTFIELGIDDIFNCSLNGFEKITNNLYVDYIKQNTGIKLSEQGVEAAAVTSIGNKCTSAGPTPELINVILDKPFMYIISDSNNLPLFVGYCYNPTIKN